MMSKKVKIIIILVTLAILGAIFWYETNRQKNATNEKEPIKIGVVLSLTGPGSFHASNIKKGIDLAISEINNNGGIDGAKINTIYEDDQTNQAMTVSAMEKLINIDRVPVIIGPQWDFEVNAAIPLADRYQISIISPHVAFDSIAEAQQQSQFVYTTFPSIATHIPAIKKFLESNSIKSATVIAVNNDWGYAHIKSYERAAQEAGVEILKVLKLSQVDNNDLRTEISLIKNLNPGAILLALNEGDNVAFARRYREYGLDAKVLGNENLYPAIRKFNASDVADGFYFFESEKTEVGFDNKFAAMFGEKPGDIGAETGYDAVNIVVEAVKISGRVDNLGINAGLLKIESYQGYSGRFNFSKQHYPEFKNTTLNIIRSGGAALMPL